MLLMHTHTPIEKLLFHKLNQSTHATQLDLRYLTDETIFKRHLDLYPTKTLIYTSLDFSLYDYLPSFHEELERFKWIITSAKEKGVRQIIFLTYPGVYFNSANLFLQHRAFMQQEIINSGLRYNFLAIQAMADMESQCHSLHSLCYVADEHRYIIPGSKKKMIYAVEVHNVAEVIKRLSVKCTNKTYELFDTIQTLPEFLKLYSEHTTVMKLPYAVFKLVSFVRNWHSPAMAELLLEPVNTMHKTFAERDLGLALHPEHVTLLAMRMENAAFETRPAANLIPSLEQTPQWFI
jgi:hypothetical protein